MIINQVLLVGTVDKCPEIVLRNNDKNSKLIKFRLKTEKPYRSKSGEVLEEFINVKVWDNHIDNIDSILETNNIVGIRGRISSFWSQKEEDNVYNEVITDKLFFIA